MKFSICLDNTAYTAKPSGHEVGIINNRVAKHVVELDIAELADKLSNGHSWCSATFTGTKRNAKEFAQSQLLVLDFDDNTQPEAVLATAKEFKLVCNLINPSFSDTPERRKFRAVFVLEAPITDNAYYKALVKGFQKVFPTCDKACKDVCRLWFGGKVPPTHLEYGYNSLSAVELAIGAVSVANVTETNKSKEAKKCTKNVQCLINNLSDERNSSIFETPLTEADLPDVLQHIDIPTDLGHLNIIQCMLQGGVYLEGESEDGTHYYDLGEDYVAGDRLHYSEIFGLVSNLKYIKGGLQWLKGKMEEAGHFEAYHFSALYQIRAYNYLPMNLDNFSPYESDCVYTNLLDATGKGNRNVVELAYEQPACYTVEDATMLFQQEFAKALAHTGDAIHVFKVPTGLGKTKLLADTIGELGTDITYAFTTNRLKREFVADAGVEDSASVHITPEMPTSLPDSLREAIDYYTATGCVRAAKAALADYKAALEKAGDNPTLLAALDEYTVANRDAYGATEGSIVTTHFKALAKTDRETFSFEHTSTIVFDEDVIPSLVLQQSVSREDLHLLADAVSSDKELSDYIRGYANEVSETSIGVIKSVPFGVLTDAQTRLLVQVVTQGMEDNVYSSNILNFFSSNFYCVEKTKEKQQRNFAGIQYVQRLQLPRKKIIVMSATADEKLYREMFKGRQVIFTEISAQGKGSLTQDSKYSYSRSSLNNPRVLKHVRSAVDELPVITFNSYKHNFLNPATSHFGNCQGYNEHTGQDLAVVGTPHVSSLVCQLFAAAIGYELRNIRDSVMTPTLIVRNGYRFKLTTFQTETMQAIQLYFIEKELIQAVGRARLLRNEATVSLFSGVPVRHFGPTASTQDTEEFRSSYQVYPATDKQMEEIAQELF